MSQDIVALAEQIVVLAKAIAATQAAQVPVTCPTTPRCEEHDVEVVSETQMRCKGCGATWRL